MNAFHPFHGRNANYSSTTGAHCVWFTWAHIQEAERLSSCADWCGGVQQDASTPWECMPVQKRMFACRQGTDYSIIEPAAWTPPGSWTWKSLGRLSWQSPVWVYILNSGPLPDNDPMTGFIHGDTAKYTITVLPVHVRNDRMVTSTEWSDIVLKEGNEQNVDEDEDLDYLPPHFISKPEFDNLCNDNLHLIAPWLLDETQAPSSVLWTHKKGKRHGSQQLASGFSLYSIFNDVVALSLRGEFSWSNFRKQHTDVATYLHRYCDSIQVTPTVESEFRFLMNQAIVPLTGIFYSANHGQSVTCYCAFRWQPMQGDSMQLVLEGCNETVNVQHSEICNPTSLVLLQWVLHACCLSIPHVQRQRHSTVRSMAARARLQGAEATQVLTHPQQHIHSDTAML